MCKVFAQEFYLIQHTYYTDRFSDKSQSPTEAHILGTTSGGPQADDVLDAEEDDQTDFHPEQRFVRKVAVLVDRRQHAEYEAYQDEHKSVAGQKRG